MDGAAPMTGPAQGDRITAGRGVSIDSSALMGADIPMLDASGAQAIGRAGEAIGEGLQQIAQPFLQLAEYQAKLVNSNRVNDARRIMEEERLALNLELEKEPDELKWLELAEKTASKTKERLGSLNVSKAANDEIESMYEGWKVSLDGNTRISSAQKSKADYKNNWTAMYRGAVDRGDIDQANGASKMLYDAGVITDGEYSEMKTNAEQGVEVAKKRQRGNELDSLKNNVIEMARVNTPQMMREWIENDYGGYNLEPDEKQYLIGVSQQIERDQTGQLVDNLTNQILSPGYDMGAGPTGIWNEKMLDAAMEGSPFYSPALKEEMMRLMDRRNRAVEQDQLKVYEDIRNSDQGVKNFYSAYHDAKNWTPDMTSEDSAVELASKIAWTRENVRDDLQGEVTQVLHHKFGMTGSKTKNADDPVSKIITTRIADIFDVDMKATREALNIALTSTKGDESNAQVISLRSKIDDYVEQQQRLKISMDDYFSEHPNASRQDAVKYFNSQVSVEKAVQDADALFGPRGESGPAGGGGFSSTGDANEDLVSMVKGLEGWNPNAYGDFKQTSIGYGTRGKPGERIDKAEGDRRLRSELSMHAKRIDESARKGGYTLTDKQRNALISFDFNTGKGAHLLDTSGGDLRTIASRMSKYRIAGGQVNKGLVNRRSKERQLFEFDF